MREKLLFITKHIRELSKNKKYLHQVNLLRSIPGIGLITAMTLLTEIEDISRFKDLDNLCSFVGLVPSTHSSGEKEIDGGITPRSNSFLRSIIIESAWIAVRNDPALLLAYEKLCIRMKPSKAIIRIAKKLLNRIRFVLKNNAIYEKRTVE